MPFSRRQHPLFAAQALQRPVSNIVVPASITAVSAEERADSCYKQHHHHDSVNPRALRIATWHATAATSLHRPGASTSRWLSRNASLRVVRIRVEDHSDRRRWHVHCIGRRIIISSSNSQDGSRSTAARDITQPQSMMIYRGCESSVEDEDEGGGGWQSRAGRVQEGRQLLARLKRLPASRVPNGAGHSAARAQTRAAGRICCAV